MPVADMGWRTTNCWIYRTACRLDGWRRAFAAPLRLPPANGPRTTGPLLYLANGRLGDALLAAAFTRCYRRWFGPVIALGRPETAAIVAPLVDHFVPIDPARPAMRPASEPGSIGRVLAEVGAAGCRAVLGDLHLFHGGDALLRFAAGLGAPMVFYDGWIDRDRQAPFRRWPAGALVVPSLAKGGAQPGDDRLHVWHDLGHFHRAVLARFGVDAALPERPWLPPGAADRAAIAGLALPAGYIACHAHSSQPKKDWPRARFAAVFGALPEQTFALLGTDTGPAPALPNVLDLRGKTSVAAAVAVAAGARAFVGVDSGLAHAAALAGVPTVVVMPQATPGYFFPYPPTFGAQVETVRSAGHEDCAGCGGLCVHEPLWRSRRHGFPCLRAIDVDQVVAALRQGLARNGRDCGATAQ